ncbi:hypothetical protein PVAP13_5NG064200 [Panicum virgatum]|uniref:Uncharacterized protein n=1 Tax=Panicum virgatum TaxID=38727 RepID=A0A8T0RQ00_PANVG|nr:hypothetical protein PVAP13_5NG064200 [Panicum virgatum]
MDLPSCAATRNARPLDADPAAHLQQLRGRLRPEWGLGAARTTVSARRGSARARFGVRSSGIRMHACSSRRRRRGRAVRRQLRRPRAPWRWSLASLGAPSRVARQVLAMQRQRVRRGRASCSTATSGTGRARGSSRSVALLALAMCAEEHGDELVRKPVPSGGLAWQPAPAARAHWTKLRAARCPGERRPSAREPWRPGAACNYSRRSILAAGG